MHQNEALLFDEINNRERNELLLRKEAPQRDPLLSQWVNQSIRQDLRPGLTRPCRSLKAYISELKLGAVRKYPTPPPKKKATSTLGSIVFASKSIFSVSEGFKTLL